MRYVDLEMYKWKWHHDIYVHTKPKPPYLSWRQYWLEDGAFTSIMPRRSGKTQMLLMLAMFAKDNGEDYRAVCPNRRMKESMAGRGFDVRKIENALVFNNNSRPNPFCGINHSNMHLLIDEFMQISKKNHLVHVLDFPWKTVTMLGSL